MILAIPWPSAGTRWWSGPSGKSSYAGAAYIFKRDVGGSKNWGQVKKLSAGDAAAGDWFGPSVSISGNTLVIGARRKDLAAGAAYIYERKCRRGRELGGGKKS